MTRDGIYPLDGLEHFVPCFGHRPKIVTHETPRMPLEIVYRELTTLQAYAGNARTHPKKQISSLKKSLLRFGWASPISIAGDRILAGHGRVTAALELLDEKKAIPGHDDQRTAPTVDLSHLDETAQRAYIIADNRIAQDAGWDAGLLKLEFEFLSANDFNLDLTGFAPIEITSYTAKPAGQKTGRRLRGGLSYQVVIECKDETDQANTLADLKARGIQCRPLIL